MHSSIPQCTDTALKLCPKFDKLLRLIDRFDYPAMYNMNPLLTRILFIR
jgi:hypothetical protein